MSKTVLVIGAGFGGLCTALRLAKKGYNVEIAEKHSQAGGRLNQIKKDGFTFDIGPSFFSMSYEFEQFAKDCNIQLPFKHYPLDPLYTVHLSKNDKTYSLNKDFSKLNDQFKSIEPNFEKKMQAYMKKSKALFDDTFELIIRKNYDSVFTYILTLLQVNPAHLPLLARNFWQQVAHHFSSDDVREIISLVAFFLGRTPFDTSSIYTLLSYTEFAHDGYSNVEGGMYKITEGMVQELAKENVHITYNTEIVSHKYKGDQLESVFDANGKEKKADIFVINSDAAAFRGTVFQRSEFTKEKLDKKKWTMGALTIYLGLKCKLPQVHHHNYYLGNNFREYADKVFKNPSTMEKPYYYVNVLSKSNSDCAPEGCEGLFFVCPVPDLRYKTDWSDRDQIVDSIISDFSKRIKQNIKPEIISKTVFTPIEWQNQFNLHRGSGLGLSPDLMQIGAFRPKNYDEKYNNVFYVGASTLPGTGLPMMIISSKLVLERIEKLV